VKQVTARLRVVSPGEIIFSEGYVGLPAMYVIRDGTVEISVSRGDSKVVLSTLRKGQFFGESVLVSPGPRTHTAKALSYCEVQVIEAASLQGIIDEVPAVLRHMLRSLILSGMKKDELLVTHENMQAQPDFLSYAHILALMAAPDSGGRQAWRDQDVNAELQVTEVVKKCCDVTGHSRRHVGATLRRMTILNLVEIENTNPDMAVSELLKGTRILSFTPSNIVARAQELAKHNLEDGLHAEQEMIELVDLEGLVGVERGLLLRKLAQGDISEEVSTFRRSEVLRFITEKGKEYFTKRVKSNQLESIDDLVTVDKRILFEALSSIDDFDLANLLQHVSDSMVREKLFSCMAKIRREEIESLLQDGALGSSDQAELTEQALLETVKALRRPVAKVSSADADSGPSTMF
jgi:CRP-like cAMP-binding protein